MIRQISAQETWPIRREVMYPNEKIETVRIENDESGLHYGYFIENQLVSVVSLFFSANEAQFRKFATLQNYQGRGIGTTLLRHLIEHCKQKKISRLWCNARAEKQGFYTGFGLNSCSDPFEKGGISYITMEMWMPN